MAGHSLRWSPARFGKTSAHCSCGTECPADTPEPIGQWFRLHQIEAMRGDFDEDEEEDDVPTGEFLLLEGDDCGMNPQGDCGKAGSEECEFGCPYGRVKRN
ncbi:MAG: hypothetical protein IT348_05795 [Candidatus Eisenbacteria bacterium]|nr:hypothetical protein [Candidatus Eisenbacteria bacterium]